jgi:hypothetical protein
LTSLIKGAQEGRNRCVALPAAQYVRSRLTRSNCRAFPVPLPIPPWRLELRACRFEIRIIGPSIPGACLARSRFLLHPGLRRERRFTMRLAWPAS